MKQLRLLFLFLVMPCTTLADTVSGYVIDGDSGERLAGVDVAFLIPADGGFSEMLRRASDEQGAFSFSGPFLTKGTAFSLVAHHDGIEHPTDALVVGEQDEVIVEVVAGTEDGSSIRFDAHHLFLTVTDVGVDVAQLIHVDNAGSATFMGRSLGSERRVLELPIPDGNLALQGHTGQVARAGPTGVFTADPLPPGRSQVAFTMQLDGQTFSGEYVHDVAYPTGRLELFLQPVSIELPSPFTDVGQVDLHDQSYRHYRLTDLVAGRSIAIPLPFNRPLRWALKWAMLGLGLLMAVAAVASVGTASTPHRPQLQAQRDRLLDELARIDDRRAAGDPQPEDEQRRADGVLQLRQLYQRLED